MATRVGWAAPIIRNDPDHRAGPVISGEFKLGHTDKVAYEAGDLFGLTDAAPDDTLEFTLEYGS